MAKEEYKIGEIPLSKFNRFAQKVNKYYSGSPEKDPILTFELVVGSLFPVCYKNVREEMRRQHALGYKAGMEEAQKNLSTDGEVTN